MVRRFEAAPQDGVKVPHMGWNEIDNLQSPLFKGLDNGAFVYFVHSFAPDICDGTIATASNGRPFAAAINKDNFYGTQFHPEKSGAVGELILKNFIEL